MRRRTAAGVHFEMVYSDTLRAAFTRVAEASFFAVVKPTEGRRWPEATAGYAASVRFRGRLSGTVTVAVPITLAYEMASAFLGREDVNDSAVRDLCGELAIHVTGTWLTEEGVAFDLEPAFVKVFAMWYMPAISLLVNDHLTMVTLETAEEP